MKFMKTIDVWEPGVQESIASGALKVQRGQWMTCGKSNPKRCRFVRVSPGGRLEVTHWQGSPSATNAAFLDSVEAYRR